MAMNIDSATKKMNATYNFWASATKTYVKKIEFAARKHIFSFLLLQWHEGDESRHEILVYECIVKDSLVLSVEYK